MRNVLLGLAWIPFFWQPLWGQAPAVGNGASKKNPDYSAPVEKSTDRRGAQKNPPVEAFERQRTPIEREEVEKQATKAKVDEQYHRDIDRWTLNWAGATAIATVILVLVGSAGTVVALCTIRQIREQTRATKESVGHLVNNERAWIFLKPDPNFSLKVGLVKLDWKIWNHGKSIARIVKAAVFTAEKSPGFKYRPFAELSGLQESIKLHSVLVPPDSCLDVWCHILGDGLDDSALKDIKDRGRELLAYGYVQYVDAFGNERESRFAYYFAIPFDEFRIDLMAPEEYHRCI